VFLSLSFSSSVVFFLSLLPHSVHTPLFPFNDTDLCETFEKLALSIFPFLSGLPFYYGLFSIDFQFPLRATPTIIPTPNPFLFLAHSLVQRLPESTLPWWPQPRITLIPNHRKAACLLEAISRQVGQFPVRPEILRKSLRSLLFRCAEELRAQWGV